MKIGIFSGTFDPFTVAHREIIKATLKSCLVDKILVIPTVVTCHREAYHPWLNDKERLLCCQEMLKHEDGYGDKIEICDKEIAIKSCSSNPVKFSKDRHYIDTLLDVIRAYGSQNIYSTIIGSDQLDKFKSWFRWDDIVRLSNIVVANGRNNHYVTSDINHIDIKINESISGTSATKIREMFDGMGLYDYLSWIEQKDGITGEKIRAFISGPMTGYENYNVASFKNAAKYLAGIGIEPVDPSLISAKYSSKEIQKMGDIYELMVEEQLQALESCSAIYMLKGWETSKGAKKELACALDCGLKIMLEK